MKPNIIEHTVEYENTRIAFQLEWKNVKNINLRIRQDGSVYVSANAEWTIDTVEVFVQKKAEYILACKKYFDEIGQYQGNPKRYITGESFSVLGHDLRLKVSFSEKRQIYDDGVFLYMMTDQPDNTEEKQKQAEAYFIWKSRLIFSELIEQWYPIFQKYDVPFPNLCIRTMKTRWGSCSLKTGKITLNRQLIEVPMNCIEYVVVHEFCHFIHPNHSKEFYRFLTIFMPDWKERKLKLEQYACNYESILLC